MEASHELSRVSVSFDEPNLVSHAGLVPVAELAQRLRVAERIDETVTVSAQSGPTELATCSRSRATVPVTRR